MQPGSWHVLLWIFLCLASAGSAHAQDESTVSFGVDFEYRSRYLFAGVPFSTGSVIQTGISLGYGGFTLNAFASYDADKGEFNERDISADYSFQPSEKIGIYFGGATYNFKNIVEKGKWDPTYEFYAGISTSFLGNPTVHYARDYSLTDGGQLVIFSLSHEVSVDGTKILGSVNIAYNDHYYRPGSDLSHYDLSASTEFQLGRVIMTPKITYQNALADDFRNFWVGILNFHRDF